MTRRRRCTAALFAVVLLAIPAALALACNPQSQLTPDKASYSPGEAMVIAGSFFPRAVTIRVTISSGQTATAVTEQDGSFLLTGLTAPAAPGNYTITAVRDDGQAQSGLPKTASFSVARPPVKPRQPVAPVPVATGGGGNFVSDPALRCRGKAVTLVGTAGDDVIYGWPGRDVIAGLRGDDVIRGLGGGDLICGGGGGDRLAGGRGRDRLSGDGGHDRLLGGAGRDRLNGGAGLDTCLGGGGRDRLARC